MIAYAYKRLLVVMLSSSLVLSGIPSQALAEELAETSVVDSAVRVADVADEADVELVALEEDAVVLSGNVAAADGVDLSVAKELELELSSWADSARAQLGQGSSELERVEVARLSLMGAANITLAEPVAHATHDLAAEALCALRGEATTARGISHALVLMLRELGVDALEVGTGSGTTWNMVCIEGAWYHVDIMRSASGKASGEDEHTGFLVSDASMEALVDENAAWQVLDDVTSQAPKAPCDWQWVNVDDADVQVVTAADSLAQDGVQDLGNGTADVSLDSTESAEDGAQPEAVEAEDEASVGEADSYEQQLVTSEEHALLADDGQDYVAATEDAADEGIAVEEPLPVDLPSNEELHSEAMAYAEANAFVLARQEATAGSNVHSVVVPTIQSGASLEEVSAMADEAQALDDTLVFGKFLNSNITGAKAVVADGMSNFSTSIDVSSYKITTSQVMTLVWEVINENPELFYVTTQVGYRVSGSYVAAINPVYLYSESTAATMKKTFNTKVNTMVSWASGCSTAQEKVKAMHDYLCRFTAYDYTAASSSYDATTSGYDPWTAYGCLVKQKCVCQGYTLALRCGLNRLGITGDYAMTSGHIWNTVKVGTSWYNVDVTSDDPGTTYATTPYSTFFLKSDSWFGYFQSDWSSNYACSSTTYDSSSWKAYPIASITGATVAGIVAKTYTGKAITQTPTVKVGTKTLKSGTDYTLSYSNNVKVGTATVKIVGKGSYTGTITKTFKINKAANPLTVKAANKTASFTTLKKKAVVVARPLTVTKAQGSVKYTKAGGSAALAINKSTGKVTVKKGTKKGTYSIKVKVTAAGNANYKAGSKTVTAKVVVK